MLDLHNNFVTLKNYLIHTFNLVGYLLSKLLLLFETLIVIASLTSCLPAHKALSEQAMQ